MNLSLLKSLSEAAGVPGREERVRKVLERECKALFDDVSTDVRTANPGACCSRATSTRSAST
jgi:putative aminopeptidase FrvX